jgi:hypothetical protein
MATNIEREDMATLLYSDTLNSTRWIGGFFLALDLLSLTALSDVG